jgi:Phage tail protein RIFT-related domain
MLTEVKAYSSWRSAPTLPLNGNRAETDLIQVRNITGLDPVKASVNTSPYGSVDGASFVGSSVLSRNIVLTLHPNPDWDLWTYENLRRLLYSYFMPKRASRLVFYSDDMGPVEITGVVESVAVNMFSKDPELLVSIICPYPYFTSVDPIVVTGQTVRTAVGNAVIIDYNGTIEAGMHVKISHVGNPVPTDIGIQVGDPALIYFDVDAGVNPTTYFEMSSIPMQKYVQNIEIGTGVITNLLSKAHIQEGSTWPILQPGENEFAVVTDQGVQDWELTYYERFGGL